MDNVPMHTPGPWSVGPSHAVARRYEDGDTRITHWVAECVGMHDQETIEANARLIAAAPELLECLIVAMETLQMEGVCGSDCISCADARAAIAKATKP